MLGLGDIAWLCDTFFVPHRLEWSLKWKRLELVLWSYKNGKAIRYENQEARDKQEVEAVDEGPGGLRDHGRERCGDEEGELPLFEGRSGGLEVAAGGAEAAEPRDHSTGPGARECKLEWVRSILDQCFAAGVPPFVKAVPDPVAGKPTHDINRIAELLNYPAEVLRQFPKTGDK